jgi:indole-3-glycerol phosphate synthase
VTILEQIVADTRISLEERKKVRPVADLAMAAPASPLPRDFRAALRGEGVNIIAEIKRASPSKGWLSPALKVADVARAYTRGGAVALSVLTEASWFKGGLADLDSARQATHLPLLCKDFTVDPYQLYEARIHGADAVLLIAAILSLEEMRTLMRQAKDLNLACLAEVHSEAELEKGLAAGANIIGVNNRNLADFSVDLNTTLRIRPLIPEGVTAVSESGIRSADDARRLTAAGVDALLVGESLVSSSDPEARIREMRREVGVKG